MAALSPYVVISLYTLKSDYNYNWPSPHSSSYLYTSDIRFCKNISPNISSSVLKNNQIIKLTSKFSSASMRELSVPVSCNWHGCILCLRDWDCLSWSIRECGNVRAERSEPALVTVRFLTIIYLITFTHHWFGHFHHHYQLCLSLITENYYFISNFKLLEFKLIIVLILMKKYKTVSFNLI